MVDTPLEDHIARLRSSSADAASATAEALGEPDAIAIELAILLHGVTQRFERFDRQTLGEHDTDAAEYLVLSLLAMGETEGRTPREMQQALQQTSGGMTRCLDRLERKGLVQRRANTVDRRSVRVVLTPEGATRTRELMEARTRTLRELFRPLGPARAARAREGLQALVATLDLALDDTRDGVVPAGTATTR